MFCSLNINKLANLTQGARAGWWFNELNQEVRHHQGGWGHYLDHPPHVRTNHRIWVFLRKSIFLIFWGPKKLLSPQNLLWPQKSYFWGGQTSKIIILIMPKKCYFAICCSKTIARIKKFQKYDPPKLRFLRPTKVFGGQKSFFGPPKIKKN